MRVSVESSGSLTKTDDFLKRMSKMDPKSVLNKFGQAGVNALSRNTPYRSGATARGWSYTVTKTRKGWEVAWHNSNVQGGAQIAVLIQYGHGTGTGGYVAGIDYINPALLPVFDGIVAELWREVQK